MTTCREPGCYTRDLPAGAVRCTPHTIMHSVMCAHVKGAPTRDASYHEGVADERARVLAILGDAGCLHCLSVSEAQSVIDAVKIEKAP